MFVNNPHLPFETQVEDIMRENNEENPEMLEI